VASVIRVTIEDAAGEPVQHDFNLADFGGQLPCPGDLIIPPGEADPPTKLWEVAHRIFEPGRGFDASGHLHVVVRVRPPL
jgi:hypothetical protein